MSLFEFYTERAIELAPDGIPLQVYDLQTEYDAALNHGIVLDRSHEAQVEVWGKTRFEFLNRMSTNDVLNIKHWQAIPTIFTTPHARIIDRVVVVNRDDDSLLMLGGPGRNRAILDYLQRNIFFNDNVKLNNLASHTTQFALHGPHIEGILAQWDDTVQIMSIFSSKIITIDDIEVLLIRMKPYVGSHFCLIVPAERATVILRQLLDSDTKLCLAGSLTYNTLRIRAGIPGAGCELIQEYIPLEVGLWDEISFNKGCYTGQEIIARMESRHKLARTMVRLELTGYVDSPAKLFYEGKIVGQITSSVIAPDGQVFAMGVIKTALATAGTVLSTHESRIIATVVERLGIQPSQDP